MTTHFLEKNSTIFFETAFLKTSRCFQLLCKKIVFWCWCMVNSIPRLSAAPKIYGRQQYVRRKYITSPFWNFYFFLRGKGGEAIRDTCDILKKQDYLRLQGQILNAIPVLLRNSPKFKFLFSLFEGIWAKMELFRLFLSLRVFSTTQMWKRERRRRRGAKPKKPQQIKNPSSTTTYSVHPKNARVTSVPPNSSSHLAVWSKRKESPLFLSLTFFARRCGEVPWNIKRKKATFWTS